MDSEEEEKQDKPDKDIPRLEQDPKAPEPSPPSPPSLSPHTHTLPDFMGALNMRPKDGDATPDPPPQVTSGLTGTGESAAMVVQEGPPADASHVQKTLAERFQKDPSAVLELLQAALSMEKLSALLKTEYDQDKEKLDNLQNQLEASYHTLKECGEQKQELTGKMEETNERIKNKRRHLESLREELKALGDEELQLKRRRDASYSRCSDLKLKLKASQESLLQISALSPKLAFTPATASQDLNTSLPSTSKS